MIKNDGWNRLPVGRFRHPAGTLRRCVQAQTHTLIYSSRLKEIWLEAKFYRLEAGSTKIILQTRPWKIGKLNARVYAGGMTEPENPSPRPKYKWPWFVLVFVVLGIVLAILWVAVAAHKIQRQRNYSEPLPDSAPAR